MNKIVITFRDTCKRKILLLLNNYFIFHIFNFIIMINLKKNMYDVYLGDLLIP